MIVIKNLQSLKGKKKPERKILHGLNMFLLLQKRQENINFNWYSYSFFSAYSITLHNVENKMKRVDMQNIVVPCLKSTFLMFSYWFSLLDLTLQWIRWKDKISMKWNLHKGCFLCGTDFIHFQSTEVWLCKAV